MVSSQIHDVCQMIKTAGEDDAALIPSDYEPWYTFMKGWIDDFKRTRTSVLATRKEEAAAARSNADAAAATSSSSTAGTAGQSEVVGAIPTAEPSSAVPGQSDATVGDISTGASPGSMSADLQQFRDQNIRDREQREAWARIYGVSPPESSTTVTRRTHRYEQWLERQLKANRETLAQNSDFVTNENYFKSEADKTEKNQSSGTCSVDSKGPVPNEAWLTMTGAGWTNAADCRFHTYVRRAVQFCLLASTGLEDQLAPLRQANIQTMLAKYKTVVDLSSWSLCFLPVDFLEVACRAELLPTCLSANADR